MCSIETHFLSYKPASLLFCRSCGWHQIKWPRPRMGRGHWVRYGRLEPQFPQKLPVFCMPHEHVQGPAGAGFGEPQLPQNLPVF